ncbi:hypothetical protein QBC45DRAFT_429096 [Copromyces sp. CBS 386.78]|nr:hypothetical protein QBC45DRAFT_429096 [Copromyces sp. CBS 386.78]
MTGSPATGGPSVVTGIVMEIPRQQARKIYWHLVLGLDRGAKKSWYGDARKFNVMAAMPNVWTTTGSPKQRQKTPEFVPSHGSPASLTNLQPTPLLLVVPTLAVFEPPSLAKNKTTTPTPWFFQLSSSLSTPGTPAEDSGPSGNQVPFGDIGRRQPALRTTYKQVTVLCTLLVSSSVAPEHSEIPRRRDASYVLIGIDGTAGNEYDKGQTQKDPIVRLVRYNR